MKTSYSKILTIVALVFLMAGTSLAQRCRHNFSPNDCRWQACRQARAPQVPQFQRSRGFPPSFNHRAGVPIRWVNLNGGVSPRPIHPVGAQPQYGWGPSVHPSWVNQYQPNFGPGWGYGFQPASGPGWGNGFYSNWGNQYRGGGYCR